MNLRQGQRIRASVTGNVVNWFRDGNGRNLVVLDNGAVIDRDQVHITRLKHPRPEVGSAITATRLRDTWWKRGTRIRTVGYGDEYVLLGTGRWVSLSNELIVDFADFSTAYSYEVVHLPGDE